VKHGQVSSVCLRLVAGAAAALALSMPALAQDSRVETGVRVRSLAAGWGTAWEFGVPGWGKTTSDVQFVAFHPGLGWFVIDRGEVFGEAALFAYYRPESTVAVGPIAVGGRYHFRGRGRLIPFVSGGAGLIVTTLDLPELDRRFNGQVFYGAGLRWLRSRGPHWRVEIRNHHISNAGTSGENLGLNSFMMIVGAEWLLSG
jgi:hypothetical protein